MRSPFDCVSQNLARITEDNLAGSLVASCHSCFPNMVLQSRSLVCPVGSSSGLSFLLPSLHKLAVSAAVGWGGRGSDSEGWRTLWYLGLISDLNWGHYLIRGTLLFVAIHPKEKRPH